MSKVKCYAAQAAKAPLAPWEIARREVGDHDVRIEIAYCGVCHSDLHQVRDEWGGSVFPMVPGHEIVGRVTKVGRRVERFKEGDLAGVGCMVDSCRTCQSCRRDLEQFCEQGAAFTYNGTEMDRKTPTYGGYSSEVVVTEKFALRVPSSLELSAVAPLLCAGITTWSPLRHWKVEKGQRVGVVGLGGLGHMAVKLAASLGAEVTMLSTSRSKEADARRLGAHEFALTRDDETFTKLAGRFDLIVDTISAPHDYNKYLGMVKVDGTMVVVGVPPAPEPVDAFSLIGGRKSLAGSLIGGIRETQEMLDYCGQHGIVADVEVIPAAKINEAYERMMKGDVRYRFVIDAKSL
ncbi:NAD(P)-dependent alcohol dehydrogenase [Anaeromyxobacter paludicola]|uniref:NADP-dependent alcohol dehydrogenase n=1 Tax=Anaeromyxobacter paludicola TaxID=2918171 RepID=A0ABN6N4Y9_9BACT|nr:NAD(P)-dependent alcohol dehydrogenase [Anaeromyxobacter paludicola]BDG07064.1 NADP-dependent alcohol dehydrogenase [Anaeromyxobacter paludicola]